MGDVAAVEPVTPIVGVIFRDAAVVDACLPALEKLLGLRGLVSQDFPFDRTSHYEAEMGTGLKRRFYSFDALHDPARLADWKLQTNRVEAQAAERFESRRPINLDPGYINGAKLVLASVKGLAHRVYIGSGIYAEVTLSYRRGQWIKRDYTFPDFVSGCYDDFLRKVRARHRKLRRESEPDFAGEDQFAAC
jgi:hypothetical protein